MIDGRVCGGCGVVLPPVRLGLAPLGAASPECAGVYAEVSGFEFQHPVMLRYHQLSVDSYGAQHAEGAPAIRVAYSLAGLWLALEHDFSGDEVRAVHQRMGKPTVDWPTFEAPDSRAWSTVLDVAEQGVRVGSHPGHARAVREWSADVWSVWLAGRPGTAAAVRDMLAHRFLGSRPALSATTGPSGAVRRLTALLEDA